MSTERKKPTIATHLIAGGSAGLMEALCCHPLDTIKVRMQLSTRARAPGVKARGFLGTATDIVKRESPLGLYKGLGAVTVGIIPKMAIRFSSFELYKGWFSDPITKIPSAKGIFAAGLLAGITEAVLVVNPVEVVKIRLQAQHHSMSDPLDVPKYRNAAHCAYTIVREEGVGVLYRGVVLTATRQATNQAVNFTAYSELKKLAYSYQPQFKDKDLPSYQHLLFGLISGAMGPLSNAPIDTIKTRMQKEPAIPGENGLKRFTRIGTTLFKAEGPTALYKGIFPRIMRVAPGQAVTFAVYERVRKWLETVPSVTEILKPSYEE